MRVFTVCGRTHELIIYVTCQQARADNLTICYRKNQLISVLYASVQLLKMNFVIKLSMKVVCGSTRLLTHRSTGYNKIVHQ